jgi:predicted O-methyltransferase YrrM
MTPLRGLIQAMFHGMEGEASMVGSDMTGHMCMLYLLARHWSFGEVVELGVGRGFSTLPLLAGAVEAGQGLVSYDINPQTEKMAVQNLRLKEHHPMRGAWRFRLKGAAPGAQDFADGSVSLWFLDTSHILEETRKELEAWLPKIHPDGVMCGHDYFLHEDPEWKDLSGVKKAVDEFAAAHPDRFHLQTLRHDRGLFILWPRTFWDAAPWSGSI